MFFRWCRVPLIFHLTVALHCSLQWLCLPDSMVGLPWGKDLHPWVGVRAPAGWGAAAPAKGGAVVALAPGECSSIDFGELRQLSHIGEGCRGPQRPRLGVSAVVVKAAGILLLPFSSTRGSRSQGHPSWSWDLGHRRAKWLQRSRAWARGSWQWHQGLYSKHF